MKSISKFLGSLVVLYLVGLALLAPDSQVKAMSNQTTPSMEEPLFEVSEPVEAGTSPAVRDITPQKEMPYLERELNPRHNPLLFESDMGKRGTWDRSKRVIDPLIASSRNNGQTPPLDLSFDGSTGCNGCSPPDVVGDVGPNHYVSMVNVHFSIFDKSGDLLAGPTAFNALFTGQGGNCESQNAGDPIPLYDPIADRWLLSQFASPAQMCIAISQTPDPLGTYHLYEFNVGSFPDYFKFGVWPDAYYMSANEGSYTAYAFDRTQMLTGGAATFQKFTGGSNLYLPSDLDGPDLPPADSPGYFYTFKDNSFHGGDDRLELYELDVDWTTPSNTTFTLVENIDIAEFTYTACGFFNFNCIRQLGTSQRFDGLGEWPMFRFPYRNFGTHQTLLGTFSVGGGTGEEGSAIRWFELRKTDGSWSLYQEGTHDPGDGHDRMNASIAMDQAGHIALGYTVSSSSMNPSIRYATRLESDPLGTLQTEAVLIDGEGSQTASNRWGDYSAMGIDPADDCTFWYTNEYYSTSSGSGWRTRVGAFHLPECDDAGPTPTPTVTNTPTATNTVIPSNTPTATNTVMPSNTPMATNTAQSSNTPIATNTAQPSNTPTATPTEPPTSIDLATFEPIPSSGGWLMSWLMGGLLLLGGAGIVISRFRGQ